MSRPPTPAPHDLHLRVSREEFDQVHRIADAEGRSVGMFIRRVLFEHLIRHALPDDHGQYPPWSLNGFPDDDETPTAGLNGGESAKRAPA